MINKAKGIIALNESTGEKRVFKSINEAARSLGAAFQSIQVASIRNGIVRGWRIYDSPEVIREKIASLQSMLDYVEQNF